MKEARVPCFEMGGGDRVGGDGVARGISHSPLSVRRPVIITVLFLNFFEFVLGKDGDALVVVQLVQIYK